MQKRDDLLCSESVNRDALSLDCGKGPHVSVSQCHALFDSVPNKPDSDIWIPVYGVSGAVDAPKDPFNSINA